VHSVVQMAEARPSLQLPRAPASGFSETRGNGRAAIVP